MAVALLPEPFWLLVTPLLPPHPLRLKGGRPPVSHRQVLTGMLFLLRTGIPWDYLPREWGGGSLSTLWRRLRDWQQAGVWQAIHQALLGWLARLDGVDWSQALVDSSRVRAVGAGEATGPSPVDRRKAGSQRHVITDGRGTPLAIRLTGAERHDTTQRLSLLDDVPGLVGPAGGRPRQRPHALVGDAAYGSRANECGARQRGVVPLLAAPQRGHGSGLGQVRWPVENTMARLNAFRHLRIRYERRADIHLALLTLACALITWQQIVKRLSQASSIPHGGLGSA